MPQEFNFLEKIIDEKRRVIETKKVFYANLKKTAKTTQISRYNIFKERISRSGKINLIAELKKASPSKGLLRKDFDAKEIARIYEAGGAAALSVLTEEVFFLGSNRYIKQIAEEVKLPILRKDFIIDEVQIYESFHIGASAILLIAAILDDAQIKDFIHLAHHLDTDCLVEVHNEAELDRAVRNGADIIGINNRNLRTFEVDLTVGYKLLSKIPKDKIKVVESGLSSHAEILKLKQMGAHAVLIGETFMKEKDIASKIRELMQDEVNPENS